MKLSFICHLVSDVSAAVSFWRDVVQLPLTYYDESVGYASFDTGGSTLALYGRNAMNELLGASTSTSTFLERQTSLSFLVDDVDATYAGFIARGATAVAPPKDYTAMQARQAHISDPDGYIIEIYCPLSAK